MRLTTILIALFALAAATARAAEPEQAREILSASGIKGGLVVHLNCGDGRLTGALHANNSYVVHGLDRDTATARQNIQSMGIYGAVSVANWSGNLLPYVDNSINLLVADNLGAVPMDGWTVNRLTGPDIRRRAAGTG